MNRRQALLAAALGAVAPAAAWAATPAGRRPQAAAEAARLLQLQEAAPPFGSVVEERSGCPILDGPTLVLLEYSRTVGTFSASRMLKDLKDHQKTAMSAWNLRIRHEDALLPLVPQAEGLNRALAMWKDSRDFEVREQGEKLWVELISQREAQLKGAERMLLPELRRTFQEFDSDRGGIAFHPELSYGFGDGRFPVGRLFYPLEPTGHLYSAIELPALALPKADPRTGVERGVVFPIADKKKADRIARSPEVMIFYVIRCRPGIQLPRQRASSPIRGRLLADLDGVLVCDRGGEVLSFAEVLKPVRL